MPPILPLEPEKETPPVVVEKSEPTSPKIIEKPPVVAPEPVEPDYKSDLGIDGKLNEFKYNPNNLVFLIDISGSMNSVNRVPLLKASIKDMVMLLRPVDRVTVVTFATESEVVIDNVPVSELPEILEAIDGLRSSGKSFGRKGLDLAYEKATASFIPGANNQVFLASDGLITASEEGMDKILTDAKYYAQRDIKTSVIGFGANDASRKFMKKLASNGKGNFLEIVKGTNTEVLLVNEIKSQSLKKK
jgi:Ca-activated chloride channel family protein